MKKGLSDPPRRFAGASRPKRAVNVSIDADLLAEAKAMNLNLSQVLENELRERLKDERIRKFQDENREAIESYNRYIAEHGAFGDKHRTW